MAKIQLRDLDMEDASFILEVENNKDIWKVSHTQEEFSRKDIEIFIAKNLVDGLLVGQKRWMITINKNRCGCIDLFDYDINNKRAGIGIVIHPDFQNQGIASKALDLMIKLCKKDLELYQMFCTIMPNNLHSIKLFESKGFIKSGTRKDWTLYENKFFDEFFYQLKL